jgi:hypothetical protein
MKYTNPMAIGKLNDIINLFFFFTVITPPVTQFKQK